MLKKLLFALLIALLSSCGKAPTTQSTQHLRLNIFTEPPTLDSRKATDATSMNVLLNLFEGLTRIGEDHLPHPAVAERIDISPDRRIYTFHLRNTRWSNGDKVTSEDFLYAWQKIVDPKFPSMFAYKFYVIENAEKIKESKLPLEAFGVKALDSKTLQVTLKYPTPYFLELVASPSFYPVHRATDIKNPEWSGDAGLDYISNGPFKLALWDHENEMLMVKNPYYWDAKNVKLNSLHFSMIDDSTTEFYMFEMNELDWAGSPLSNLPPEFIAALKNEGVNDIPVNFYAATAVYYYKLNTQRFPLNNRSIRRALGYAIHRKDIVQHITQAGQIPATSLVPPMPGWEKPSALFEDGNNALAKKLFDEGLEELGLSSEQFPKLTLCYNTNREHQKIAQAIQQQWKETLGIEVELQHFDWKVYLSKISNQDYDIGRMGWVGDFHDPVSFLEPFKYKNDPDTGGNNDTGWEHPEYISYLEQAEKELDLSKRAHLLRNAEALLISEMPVVPIYYIVNGYLKKPYVHGVYLSPLGVTDFKKAYIGVEKP